MRAKSLARIPQSYLERDSGPPKQNPPKRGACIPGGAGEALSVATQSLPYIADFCKRILATGEVCPRALLPGGLRCNLKEALCAQSLIPRLPCPASPG
jgi:hypothetical protein